jgi:hypothetical protein
MSAAPDDLALVVVGSDRRAIFETLESIMWQTQPLPRVVRCTAPNLKRALDSIGTAWVSVLPQGTQLDPNWLAVVRELALDPECGAFGGRTLEMRGPQTSASWFEVPAPITAVDALGRYRSLLEDIPDHPTSEPCLFLRWDNMVCRTAIIRDALEIADDVTIARHAVRACSLAAHRGLGVLYDSRLRSTRAVESAETSLLELHRNAGQEVFELASLPSWFRAARATATAILVGDRIAPGLLLGFAYVWWPKRRARWRFAVGGKLQGLGRVIVPTRSRDSKHFGDDGTTT